MFPRRSGNARLHATEIRGGLAHRAGALREPSAPPREAGGSGGARRRRAPQGAAAPPRQGTKVIHSPTSVPEGGLWRGADIFKTKEIGNRLSCPFCRLRLVSPEALNESGSEGTFSFS